MSSRCEVPIAAMDAALDDLAEVDPVYQSSADRMALLKDLARVEARVQAARLRALAASDDIAVQTGARSTGHWLAAETRDGIGAVLMQQRIAQSAGAHVVAAMREGSVNLSQARVITDALDRLPKDLDPQLREKGEAYLVAEAGHLGPKELTRLGQRLMEVIAPEEADEAEYQALLAEERRSRAATRITFRDRGDGSTDVHARIPTPVAHRLKTHLEAYASPRRNPLGDVDRLPGLRRRGEAFCVLLENLPASGLPKHGGTTTSVMVMLTLDDLRAAGHAVADTSTGDRVSASQARRLACQAGILPVVLGGEGEILDLGRTRRLFSPAQRKAMAIRDRECTADGCDIPASWTEAHHFKQPWSQGGKTDLADGKLLCPFHHHRAHDPGWETRHRANGSTTFHRRT